MLEWLRAHHCVDGERVFVMGYSNGAGLASVLACERAGAIAGVGHGRRTAWLCARQPKPVIISHGTRDQTIGYEQAIQAAQVWSKTKRVRRAAQSRRARLLRGRLLHVGADDDVHA